jgi:ligand-binding sensor domain-containing protein
MRGLRPTCIIGTAKGEIWVGTAGNGLLIYRGGEWLKFGASTGLSDDYIRSLCEDQKGIVWIGTQFGGITRYTTQSGM